MMQTEYRRAAFVCLVALILSAIFFPACFVLSRVTGVYPLFALSWQILAAALIWAVLAVQFYQKSLAEQEKLDIAQLAQGGAGDTIFEAQKNNSEFFAVAQNRLRIFEKWFLPIFSILIAIYQIAIGSLLLRMTIKGRIGEETKFLLLGAVLASAIAFVSFLFSLYATGLASQEKWRPLKAGGSYFLATTILSFICAAAMALAQFKVQIVLVALNWIVPSVLILVGCETALNFIFDIYRPRIKGQYSSSAFDSRLLGIIASPHHILRTVASVIDYQFGFKVSQTWFYQIVEQAIIPLILVSAVILYLLSCIVIIDPGSQAIIEKLGSPVDSHNKVRLVGSGISFKLPWPFGITREFPTKEIQEIYIGYVPLEDQAGQKQPLLWGSEHYKEEYNLLVATETINSQEKGAVPVSIIRGSIPVQYRVIDLYKYLYNHADSKEVLKAICYREVIKFAAGAHIEPEVEGGSSEESLLGAGRAKAAIVVARNIQQQADNLSLGVEIVFMGFEGFHPPPQVAQDFQAVIGAVQKKQASILEAIAQRDRIFTGNVGSVKQAITLHQLAEKYLQSPQKGTEYEQIKLQLDKAFTEASGELFAKLRGAQSYAYEKSTLAKAAGERFSQQLQAYRASKRIYTHELKMNMLEESLEKIRKYIVVSDSDTEVTIVDLQEKLVPSLYDIEPIKGQ
ncbi:MAG: SPFH domain-containing protein [Phycisphaerae bacterium]|jgi:regulator of protease activity HflC (stomatin/prohibitin superfamily)